MALQLIKWTENVIELWVHEIGEKCKWIKIVIVWMCKWDPISGNKLDMAL